MPMHAFTPCTNILTSSVIINLGFLLDLRGDGMEGGLRQIMKAHIFMEVNMDVS